MTLAGRTNLVRPGRDREGVGMDRDLVRFVSKTTALPCGCWRWDAGLDDGGYGMFSVRHVNIRAHQWIHEYIYGPIPEGMERDHKCRNRWCVNPDHLEVVTKKVNILRGEAPTVKLFRAGVCKNGHDLTNPDNVYPTKRGSGRRCKPCALEANKRSRDGRVKLSV